MDLYFSQHFEIDPAVLRGYGAFDISIASDLPLFVDPFLLFNSEKPEYQDLHKGIIRYLVFLRDKAVIDLDPGLIASWYRFKEVKQNWFGYTLLGNDGSALGPKFAAALHQSLGSILSNFGEEQVTQDSHLEKLCLIGSGVGRDGMSDFTTNLIKSYLCEYTEAFSREHIDTKYCEQVQVARAAFNYRTETWETRSYYLPVKDGDFFLLTPRDMLTREEAWINYSDMVSQFDYIPDALPDDALRAQVNNYFRSHLGQDPKQADRDEAAKQTYGQFPELVDYYIKLKEETGDRASVVSEGLVNDTQRVLVVQLQAVLGDLPNKSDFYDRPWTSYDEALDRVHEFKRYVEDNDGYKLINRAGQPFSQEKEVQLFFGLIWCKSDFDANREPNNGRGPVDFKVSYGSGDKSLIEFKLGSNKSLKRNLQKQVAIYEAANGTRTSVKVVVYYTQADYERVQKILSELELRNEPSVVLIDARSDNKPSASVA